MESLRALQKGEHKNAIYLEIVGSGSGMEYKHIEFTSNVSVFWMNLIYYIRNV